MTRRLIAGVATAILSVASTGAVASAAASSNVMQLEHAIQVHLENRETAFSLTIPASVEQDVNAALSAALQSDPYLAHDYSNESVEWQDDGTTATVQFHIKYLESKAQYQYVLKRVSQILGLITKPGMSDLQKELAIHDYIVLNTAYDQSQQKATPYDALEYGTTVCNGYAMLTYLLMTKAGIPCKIVDGYAGGEAHSWNMVQINGHWYNLDTTWDDPVPDQPGKVRYDYFNMTDAQINRDHTRTTTGLPAANTDFVNTLQSQSKSSAVAKRVLYSTGLYLELPQYTFNSVASLTKALRAASSQPVYSFRIPASFIDKLNMVSLATPCHYTYTTDKRDPGYDIVTARFSH